MIPFISIAVTVLLLVLTGFYATVFRISVSFLQGLHAYLLPEECAGVYKKADETDTGQEAGRKGKRESFEAKKNFGKRQKNRDKHVKNEPGSQLLRISLAESQLESRQYFQEYDDVIVCSCLGLVNILTREMLYLISTLEFHPNFREYLKHDDRIYLMVGSFVAYKILWLLAQVSISRDSGRLLSFGVGTLGFFVANTVLFFVPKSFMDFDLDGAILDNRFNASLFVEKGVDSTAGFTISPFIAKLCIGLGAGAVAGLLSGPALRSVKIIWVPIYQLKWNMSIMEHGFFVGLLLKLSMTLPLLTSLLWIKPIASYLIWQTDDSIGFDSSGAAEEKFSQCRLWGLFVTGLLQICLFRVNVQSYSNIAVLDWYQSLQERKNQNSAEVTKAKIYINNYFVCKVALQCLVPGVLILVLIGLTRIRGAQLNETHEDGIFFLDPAFIRALITFLSWWVVFAWALQTSLLLALFRMGILKKVL